MTEDIHITSHNWNSVSSLYSDIAYEACAWGGEQQSVLEFMDPATRKAVWDQNGED